MYKPISITFYCWVYASRQNIYDNNNIKERGKTGALGAKIFILSDLSEY